MIIGLYVLADTENPNLNHDSRFMHYKLRMLPVLNNTRV